MLSSIEIVYHTVSEKAIHIFIKLLHKLCDNELIVYVIADNIWAKYSMSDDVLFRKKASLEEIL